MTKPLTPNFVPGVGRLTTYVADFQAHINGTGFRHNATQIDLSPSITIGPNTYTDVQDILADIATFLPPAIPSATPSVLGLITLGGDLNGTGTTAAAPRVSGLQGRPVQNLAPSTGQILTWNGSLWGPANNNAAVTFTNDVTGNNAAQTVVQVSGDTGGTLNIGTANSTTTLNIGNGDFVGVINIGTNPGPAPSIVLGDAAGSVTIPNVGGNPNAMLIATNSGQLSPVPAITYTFTGTPFLNIGTAVKIGSLMELSAGFTNVTTLPYTVDSGAMPDYLLLVGDDVSRVINLPTVTAGRVIRIKDASSSANIHNITINSGGPDIDGGLGTIIIEKQNGFVELTSDGSVWFITGSYQYP